MITSYEWYMHKYKENKDKRAVKHLAQKLVMKINKEYSLNCKLSLYGDFQNKGYSIWIKSLREEDQEVHLDFKMKLFYPESTMMFVKNDQNRSDRELELLLKNRMKLKFGVISGLYVTPRKHGIGSFVMENIKELLKELESVEYIGLKPKDEEAVKFWEQMGFTKAYKNGVKIMKLFKWHDHEMIYKV